MISPRMLKSHLWPWYEKMNRLAHDKGRLVVAINHNMDLGDAWEHADTPGYPEPMTALAYRFAVNYVIYAMTH